MDATNRPARARHAETAGDGRGTPTASSPVDRRPSRYQGAAYSAVQRPEKIRRLADDFFLIVHDEGQPRLSGRILGVGLAAALLAELALLDAVRIRGDKLLLDRFPTQVDPFLVEIIGQIHSERPLPVRDWLDYLAGAAAAAERVGGRLVARGLMQRRAPLLRLPGLSDRWIPVDSFKASWPAVDVRLAVSGGAADAHHLVLFGLASVTGLNHHSLYSLRGLLQDPAAMTRALEPLADHPPLLELLAHAHAAVASAVSSRRHF